ncbi:MAG TPA: hypothetical protein VFR07_11200 [Mycobacteriales bacterium]|jgi:hypothetical protein|nr:hypothetical protein [Mycobacteriales bacterium]
MTTQERDEQPASAYLLDMLHRLYPAPLLVRRGGRAGADTLAAYLAIPGINRPRLLVPAGRPRVAARTAARQLTGQRARTRAARVAAAVALRTGLLDRGGRHQLLVTGPDDAPSVTGWLCKALGVDEVLLTMPVGPARATRKPVLQVSDRDGVALAYVKVGHDSLTRTLVGREAAVLRKAGAARSSSSLAPQVLAFDEDWHGLTLLVLEPLPLLGTRRRGALARRGLLDVVEEIFSMLGCEEYSWAASPLRRRLEDELATLDARGDGLRAELARIDAQAPVQRLGAWHGDLNPGNLALRRQRTYIWDWERFEQNAPLGFDLLHHDLHRWLAEQGRPPLEAARQLLRRAADLMAPLGVPPADAQVTAHLYLITLGSRYLRDHQAEAGVALGRVDEWIVPALRDDPLADR